MIRIVTTKPARKPRAVRQTKWHRVFVLRRRFHCPRLGATVAVTCEHIERRRDYPGGPWTYRTIGA